MINILKIFIDKKGKKEMLNAEDRLRVWRGLMRHWSNLREPVIGITKEDLFAAVEATDNWIEANQSSYNIALPDAFRNNATQAQKALLFCVIALARVSMDFLRRVIGSVD